MPITPLSQNPKLPVHMAAETLEAREAGACPIRTFDWYRLTDLFMACKRMFGNSFMNMQSRTRRLVDGQMTHTCDCFRDKYMDYCSEERMAVCCRLLEGAADATIHRPGRQIPPWPYFVVLLRKLINDEQSHAVLKPTIPKQTYIMPIATKTM